MFFWLSHEDILIVDSLKLWTFVDYILSRKNNVQNFKEIPGYFEEFPG